MENKQNYALQNTKIQNDLLAKVDELALTLTDLNVVQAKRQAFIFANSLRKVKDKAKRPALEVCTPASIQQCFLEVLEKNIDLSQSQGALVVYGNELQIQLEYFGNVKQAKEKVQGLVDIRGTVVYKGDTLKIEVDKGIKKVVEHITKFENISDKNIIGAYSTAIFRDSNGIEYIGASDIMTLEELRNSWQQSQNGTSVHYKFGHEMARKTVESRTAKHLLKKCVSYVGWVGADEEIEQNNDNFTYNVDNIIESNVEIENKADFKPNTEVLEEDSIIIATPTENAKMSEKSPYNEEIEIDNKIDNTEVIEGVETQQAKTTNASRLNGYMKENNDSYLSARNEETSTQEELSIPYGEYLKNKERYKLVRYDNTTKCAIVVEK